MRVRAVTAGIAAGAVVLGVVSACGGGGYGGSSTGAGASGGGSGYGGSGNGSGNPPPAVAFSTAAHARSGNLGPAVNIAWTWSNATSCTTSASNPTGGSFTGSQAVSGHMSVVPTA